MSTLIDVSDKMVSFDEAISYLQTDSRAIVVYSKPSCVQCTATYRALTKKGLDFRVVDVTEYEAGVKRITAWNYEQVPVVETPAEHWHGYRPDKITTLAALVNA